MKLITLATITLTLLAPVTHGAESKAEQLQVLEDARNVALTASRKQDALLAGLSVNVDQRNVTAKVKSSCYWNSTSVTSLKCTD